MRPLVNVKSKPKCLGYLSLWHDAPIDWVIGEEMNQSTYHGHGDASSDGEENNGRNSGIEEGIPNWIVIAIESTPVRLTHKIQDQDGHPN